MQQHVVCSASNCAIILTSIFFGENDSIGNSYRTSTQAVLKTVIFDSLAAPNEKPIAFARSGPKERLFFNPPEVAAAIVTCGGICPGLNTVFF